MALAIHEKLLSVLVACVPSARLRHILEGGCSMFRALALALGALLLVGSSVLAATNTWAPGFPTIKGGVIKIKGTATADSGFTLGNKGTAVAWPAGRKGGVVTSFSINVDTTTGQWSADLTGLAANTRYVIVVQ